MLDVYPDRYLYFETGTDYAGVGDYVYSVAYADAVVVEGEPVTVSAAWSFSGNSLSAEIDRVGSVDSFDFDYADPGIASLNQIVYIGGWNDVPGTPGSPGSQHIGPVAIYDRPLTDEELDLIDAAIDEFTFGFLTLYTPPPVLGSVTGTLTIDTVVSAELAFDTSIYGELTYQ
jgi:hypothetical protein